jgi:hypothetical protein
LGAIEKSSSKPSPTDLIEIATLAEDHLFSDPACNLSDFDLFIIYPGHASFALESKSLQEIRSIKSNVNLWKSSLMLRMQKVDLN